MRTWLFVASVAVASIAACVGDSTIGPTDSGVDSSINSDSGGGDTGMPASDASGDASDGGTWVPSAFGVNLVLWLEGDVGITLDDAGGVAAWQDQSLYPVTMAGSGALTDITPNNHVVVNFNATNVNVQTASVSELELGATDKLHHRRRTSSDERLRGSSRRILVFQMANLRRETVRTSR